MQHSSIAVKSKIRKILWSKKPVLRKYRKHRKLTLVAVVGDVAVTVVEPTITSSSIYGQSTHKSADGGDLFLLAATDNRYYMMSEQNITQREGQTIPRNCSMS